MKGRISLQHNLGKNLVLGLFLAVVPIVGMGETSSVHARRLDPHVVLHHFERGKPEANSNSNNRPVLWPSNGWETATPAEMGMNKSKLTQAKNYATSEGGGSGLITRGGRQ
jgi:hypothetical protein